MHLIKCQASFKYCNDSNGFCRKIYISIPGASCLSAHQKTNCVTPVTVMIWFQKESISMVVSDNKHHDKRTVVPFCLLFLTVKEMFGGNIQNITIWVDMAYLVSLKIILSLGPLVIKFLCCFFIIIINMELCSNKSWKEGFDLL